MTMETNNDKLSCADLYKQYHDTELALNFITYYKRHVTSAPEYAKAMTIEFDLMKRLDAAQRAKQERPLCLPYFAMRRLAGR